MPLSKINKYNNKKIRYFNKGTLSVKTILYIIMSLCFSIPSINIVAIENAHFYDAQTTLRMYQMLKDVHELLTLKKIPYWADFGTMLGAIRHKGIIPWDDDMDISIDRSQALQVEALAPLLHKLGYGLVPFFFGYKIFPLDGEPYIHEGKEYNFTTPYLDIFLTFVEDNKVFYTSPSWGNRGDLKLYKTLDELFPLKDYTFGSFTVKGPRDPSLYFNAFYGNNWYTTAKVRSIHPNKEIAGKTFILQPKDRIPAMPVEPLQDRCKNI